MGKEVKAGNPNGRSPVQVNGMPEYEEMIDYTQPHYYPLANEIVVMHKSTKTYWRTIYRVYDDYSEYDCGATWTEVVPEKVTITRYKAKV